MAPLYEFQCPECSREVEAFQNLSEFDKPFYCVECFKNNKGKKVQLKRLISMTAPPQFGPGIPGTSSQEEWSAKQRSKLEARSNAYDKTTDGQEQIHKSLVRAKKNQIL